jgi:F-type H+-transporting ATPase subunit b
MEREAPAFGRGLPFKTDSRMELLTPGTGLIIWQTFVFLGLVFLIGRYAWKPILSSLKEREQSIQQALESAEAARKEMARLQADNEKIIREARDERDKILAVAREAGNRLQEEAREEARKSADRMIQDAKSAIEREKQAALRDVREQVASFSLEVAEKLLRRNLSSDKAQKELIETFVKDIKVN